jgi:hypothetical protein
MGVIEQRYRRYMEYPWGRPLLEIEADLDIPNVYWARPETAVNRFLMEVPEVDIVG